MHVRVRGELRQGIAPLRYHLGQIRIGEHSCVHQDEVDLGEIAHQLDRVLRLRGEYLQLEVVAEFFKQPEPVAELRRVAQVGPGRELIQRARIPVQLMPHAAHRRKAPLRLEL